MTTSKRIRERYGKFNPYNTFNVDKHPLPFASADPSTLEFIGTERVLIREPGSGLSTRQLKLQLLIRPLPWVASLLRASSSAEQTAVEHTMHHHRTMRDIDKELAQYDP